MTSQVMGRRLRVQKRCVALSILSLAALPGTAAVAATVTISTATTTPLQTATVDGGNPGDIALVSGGTISPANASAPAITLNSNNTVKNGGGIIFTDLANTVGIDVQSGFTGTVDNAGAMTMGAPVSGTTHPNYADNKAAIRIDAGTFSGSILNEAAGAITVYGDNSAGIDIQGAVTGDIDNEGSISVVGDHSAGIRILAPLTGNLTSKNVNTIGIGTSAILVEAPVTGAFAVNGIVGTTGYDHPINPATYTDSDVQITQQSGPAIGVGASIGKGIYFNGPSYADNKAVAAGDTTVTPPSQSVVNPLSSADAVLISPTLAVTPADITLGVVGTGDKAYGFVNRGTLSGTGGYDALTSGGLGVSAEAVRIEGATIGGTDYHTVLTGGLRNDGTISATALTNFANGLVIGNLATVPVISNTGVIGATVKGGGSFSATGILILPGANVGEIDNNGSITATLTGATGDAVAIRDQSGTLTTINNTGQIGVSLVPATNSDGTVTLPAGKMIAADLSAASNDITFTNDVPSDFSTAGSNAGKVTGDLMFGSGNDTLDMKGGSILSNITFGAGNDSLIATGGSIAGTMDFGTGTNLISIDGGAIVQSKIASAGPLSIAVNKGELDITSDQPIPVTSATFGSSGVLGVTINTTTGNSTRLDASGTISFASGAEIVPAFSGAYVQDITSTILTTPNLQIAGGDVSSLLSAKVPYIYKASLSEASSGGIDSVDFTLTRKTTQELGIPQKLGPALDAMLRVMPGDVNLNAQFAALTTQATFGKAFEELLPSYTDAWLALAKQSTMVSSRQIRERLENALSERRAGGAWVSESIYTLNRDLSGGTRGYDGQGTVLGLGLDDYVTHNILAGIEFGVDHGSYQEDGDIDHPVSIQRWMGGAYVGAREGNLYLSGSVLGALTSTDSSRGVVIGSQLRATQATWGGSRYSADFAATYLGRRGRWSFKPAAGVEYFHINDSGYTETGGTDPNLTTSTNAMALQVGPRSADAAIAYGRMVVGYDLSGTQKIVPYQAGQPYILRPELTFGFRRDLINSTINTRARYVGDASWFTIASDPRDVQDFNAGIGLNFETAYGTIGLDADGILGEHTKAFVGKLNATFRF